MVENGPVGKVTGTRQISLHAIMGEMRLRVFGAVTGRFHVRTACR